MKLFVYKLGGTLFEGDIDSITMPTQEGEITVLSQHIPLVTHLSKGSIIARTKNANQEFAVTGGFAEIKPEKIILLVE